MTEQNRIMMAYGVMKLTLKEIVDYGKPYTEHNLCDCINISKKALAAVKEIEDGM